MDFVEKEGLLFSLIILPFLSHRQAIVNYNCRELVRAVPFFYDADPDFVSAIITKLDFEVYLEGDVIIREGELGTEMYFLKSGVVSVSCEGVSTDDLSDGAYFGGEFKATGIYALDYLELKCNSKICKYQNSCEKRRRCKCTLGHLYNKAKWDDSVF